MTKIVWIFLFIIITTIPIFTIGKVFSLQENNTKTISSPKNPSSHYKERGAIYDRKGNILAMQVESWNLGLRLIDTDNPQEVFSLLSETLNIPLKTIKQRLKNPEQYVRIKKLISKKEHDKILMFKKQGKLKGVQIHSVRWRTYPGIDSMANIIGYFGTNEKGLDGIEKTFDKYLQPQANDLGNSIYLTIDSILQKSIEEIVKETFIKSKPSFINTILMDAKTGEILSFVSIPSFDLNTYYTYSQKELTNRIIQYNYEPGSVFKIFTIASLLDANIITPDSIFNASGPWINKQYGFAIHDVWYPGTITTYEIIKYSSNVGTSQAVNKINKTDFFTYLKNFGFGETTGISLPGESQGIFYSPYYWSARSKQTIGLGQEIAITAMQIITAATALTNNGNLLTPRLIKKIISQKGKTLYAEKRKVKRKVISENVAKTILDMMKGATDTGGTAHRMKIEGINISAKTGTAQVFDTEQKQYSKTKFIASTLGIMPTENPKIIIYAAIHNPTSGEIYGGRTTAPMIKKMLEFILPYMGMVGDSYLNSYNTNVNIPLKRNVTLKTQARYGDYTRMSKREIWTLFANKAIYLSIKGNGHVIRQTPPAGTLISENPTLTLFLE